MHPDLVADIGNTRMKWGQCRSAAGLDRGAVLRHAALAAGDPDGWPGQLRDWGLAGRRLTWVVSSVQPRAREQLVEWLRRRGDEVRVLERADHLPLKVLVERPDHVGIDRLLDAVAANSRRRPGAPAVLIDAGSAITVDWVDESGAFAGGAILPGLRLMARALHDHTALLPLVEITTPFPSLPGITTPAAVEGGVFWTAVGGVRAAVEQMCLNTTPADGGPLSVFLTGGDGPVLEPALRAWAEGKRLPVGRASPVSTPPAPAYELTAWPLMTLEGIRLSAEALA